MVEKTFAIVMLCMLQDHYVLGACVAAYVHRYLFSKIDKRIELVIMCDENIYQKHSDTLLKYFDKVIKIKLYKFDKRKDHQTMNKFVTKYGWIIYSTNKWQCLKFTEYEKILFIDIDVLPISQKFYEIFDYDTPGFHFMLPPDQLIKQNYEFENDCTNNTQMTNLLDKFSNYEQYASSLLNVMTLDGGIVLLKPDIEIYKQYVEFINKIYHNGIYSAHTTGPDETSLFYFFVKEQPKKTFYRICGEHIVIPWDFPKHFIKKATAYNFLSYVKPWLKSKFLMWPEELLWRVLYDNMAHYGDIESLFKKVIVKGFRQFLESESKKVYNLKYYNNLKNNAILNNPNINDDILFNEIIRIEQKFCKDIDFGMLELKDIVDLVSGSF